MISSFATPNDVMKSLGFVVVAVTAVLCGCAAPLLSDAAVTAGASYQLPHPVTVDGSDMAGASLSSFSFCKLSNFTFHANDGKGSGRLVAGAAGGCDGVEMKSEDTGGLAASFASAKLPIVGGRRYNASFSLRTKELVSIPGGPAAGAASLTGGIYLHFFDVNGDSGAWNPQFGQLAPSDVATWRRVDASFMAPTTARTVQVHLTFAAHTFTYSPDRMRGGRATGLAAIANVSLIDAGPALPLPSTIEVPHAALQSTLHTAFACLHNSKQSGNFTVGAGYTISGNISPDLTFGLHGVRRTAYPAYVEQMQRQWSWHAPSGTTGQYTAGRVMGQINWPLGVDNLFSFHGDESYLQWALPLVDASLAFVHAHADAQGLVTLVPFGAGHVGGGADWVDWYKTRLDGRSFQFHMWYVRTLRRFAELHREFGGSFGNTTRADTYEARANALARVLGGDHWRGDHWLTNPDYPDEGEWMDDSVWSVYHGIANASQAETLWARVDRNASFYEAVPTRWGNFPTMHWACSWFGRLGAGDIMARYRQDQRVRAFALLERFANIVAAQGDIYEGYDMHACGLARCGCTTSGFGDYLEHCGGVVWAVTEGVFGLSFDSHAADWAAVVEPRFPASWPEARLTTYLRGLRLTITWTGSSSSSSSISSNSTADGISQAAKLTLAASAALPTAAKSVNVRVLGCRGGAKTVRLTVGAEHTCEMA